MASFALSAGRLEAEAQHMKVQASDGSYQEEERADWEEPQRSRRPNEESKGDPRERISRSGPASGAWVTTFLPRDCAAIAKSVQEEASRGTARIVQGGVAACKRLVDTSARETRGCVETDGVTSGRDSQPVQSQIRQEVNEEDQSHTVESGVGEKDQGSVVKAVKEDAQVAGGADSIAPSRKKTVEAFKERGVQVGEQLKEVVGAGIAVASAAGAFKLFAGSGHEPPPGKDRQEESRSATVDENSSSQGAATSFPPFERNTSEESPATSKPSSTGGGRSWAVLASVYETASAVLDEGFGDLITS